MTEAFIQRAEILIRQNRFLEAETILKDALSQDPTDVLTLTLLAETQLSLEKPGDADVLVDTAIALEPSEPHLYYLKGRISLVRFKYDAAEKYLNQAIALDPLDAAYHGMLASVKLQRKDYSEALEIANKALELDAENLLALNTRSSALMKLNRKEDSFATIEGALREDPNNTFTHANYGWNLLESGDHKKARVHFREALKNDPMNEYAREGMAEAVKAGNIVYRLYLKYAFFIGKLRGNGQWAVIIGFYLFTRLMNTLAKSNPKLEPLLMPIVIFLAILAFSTWVVHPLGNALLRLSRNGKYLLNKKQLISSGYVAAALFTFITGALLYLFFQQPVFLAMAIYGFVMMVPLGSMFALSRTKNVLLIYSICMGVFGFGGVLVTLFTGDISNPFALVFAIGFVLYQWVANYMIIDEDNV